MKISSSTRHLFLAVVSHFAFSGQFFDAAPTIAVAQYATNGKSNSSVNNKWTTSGTVHDYDVKDKVGNRGLDSYNSGQGNSNNNNSGQGNSNNNNNNNNNDDDGAWGTYNSGQGNGGYDEGNTSNSGQGNDNQEEQVNNNGASTTTAAAATTAVSNNNNAVNKSNNNNGNVACVLSDPIALRDGLTLQQAVNVAEETYTMTLTYQGQAWLGIGTSPNGRMVGNIAVIGLPDTSSVQAFYLGGHSLPQVTPLQSATNTIANGKVAQTDSETTLSFTRPLRATGQADVSSDASNTFIYAVGSSNALNMHRYYASFSLQLSPCANNNNNNNNSNSVTKESGVVELLSSSNKKSKRMFWAHGFLMAAAWAFLSPVAVGSSLIRKYLPTPSTWFVLHRVCNVLALIFTIVGFALAVRATSNNAGPGENPEHFSVIMHRRVGLVVFILAMLQGFNGVFRPHMPSSPSTADDQDKIGEESFTYADNVSATEEGRIAHAPQESFNQETTKVSKRYFWQIGHRLMGVTVLGAAWCNCSSGIERYTLLYGGNRTVLTAIFWTTVLVIAVPTVSLNIFHRIKKRS